LFDKHYIGLDITGFENNGKSRPVSRVTLLVDNDNAITAGDDTGMELLADCPHATQAMADAILAQVKGYQYKMYSGDDANIDPAAELGDGATVNGVYSVISRIDDDGSGYAGISAPGDEELEDEYPAAGPMTQEFNRKISETRSSITKTAEEIRLEVQNELKGLSSSIDIKLDEIRLEVKDDINDLSSSIDLKLDSIELTVKGQGDQISQISQKADSIELTVQGQENEIATIKNTVNSITLSVSNGSSSSTISLMKDGITVSSQSIDFSGMVKFTDLSTPGTTSIYGGNIDTSTLRVDNLYGTYVYLRDQYGNPEGYFTITSASTAGYAVDLTSYGALRMTANSGDVYIQSSYGPHLRLSSYEGVVLGGGNTRPNNSIYSCGTSSFPWADIFSMNSQIQTSDRNKKHDIEPLPEKYLDMLGRIEPKRFKMNDGTSGRYHVGFIAQEVEDAMTAAGVDSLEFGGWVKDRDEDGNDIYMLRYSEFIGVLWGKLRQMEARIKELEGTGL